MSEDAPTAVADATRTPTVDASRIQWRDATSGKGRKFQIGTLKPDDDSEVAIVGNRENFGVQHDESGLWLTVDDDAWKKPPQRVSDRLDITEYYLTKNHLSWFNYILHIKNRENWNYTFYDESGDSYFLSTFRQGDHSVAYDSDKPTIVRIVAEA